MTVRIDIGIRLAVVEALWKDGRRPPVEFEDPDSMPVGDRPAA